jgi:hypothetical protein
MTLFLGNVGAFRSGACAIGLLAAFAACGRIGYESAVHLSERDGSIPALDAEGVDQRSPGLDLGSDVLGADAASDPTPDLLGPDGPDASTSADGALLPDATGPMDARPPDAALDSTPPRDLGVDAPTTRTVVATGQNATPRRGGGGAGTVDLCPDGSLLVGYEGTHSANPTFPWIHSVVGICATVTLPPTGVPPTDWVLTLLPARGSTNGVRWTRTCPDRHVLVGFDGNAGSWMGQIAFVCAPIALSASGQAVVLGSVTELDDVGAPADNDFLQTECPPGQAARGAETRAGSFLEAFGLICGSLVLR